MGDANEGRLGNVAGVVLSGDSAARVREAADLLERICEQVVIVDEPEASLLGRLVAGLQAADAQRVLVLDASFQRPSLELVLALTAWPEGPAVVAEMAADVEAAACVIYVREAVLPRARARLESGETGLPGLLSECGASFLDDATLTAIREAGG